MTTKGGTETMPTLTERNERIVSLFDAGNSRRDIARLVGCTKRIVDHVLYRSGRVRHAAFVIERWRKVLALDAAGLTHDQLAVALGIRPRAVRRTLFDARLLLPMMDERKA
jgi:hypothetical protein